jgi:hypothetical protein
MTTALYMRVCEMNVNGRVLTYPPMTLEFETEFSDRTPSQTKAKIYNPAPDTVSACEKRGNAFAPITISAGYQEDFGTCVVGEIVKYENKKGRDSVLELTVSDKTSLWASAIINKSWKGVISARDAATQILRELGITPAEMGFGEEKSYQYGISFSGVPLRTAMERIARDTKSRFRFSHGQASFTKDTAGSGTAFLLKYETGLLEASKTNGGYKIRTLFMYKMQGASLLHVVRPALDVLLRVRKGKPVFSPSGLA